MTLWLAGQPLLLASKSQIRRAILADAGIPVEVLAADVDERGIEQRATIREPNAIAALLAREKTHAIAARFSGRIVLGADQVLALDGQRYSKPPDRSHAREQLKVLRGRTHELHTALALARDGTIVFEHSEVARLTMRAFSDAFLEAYLRLAGDAVMASVGAYQLERAGVQLFERIEGDHHAILGLPLIPLLNYLRTAGCLVE